MKNKDFILDSAYDLNGVDQVDNISKYYIQKASVQTQDICNRVVILLAMCINKELNLTLKNVSLCDEQYPDFLKAIYERIFSKYIKLNIEVVKKLNLLTEAKKEFYDYLEYVLKSLLSGVKYIEKRKEVEWTEADNHNEWNTRYRREERVRDYMKVLISSGGKYTNFTIKNNIEIPYMYVLAWDLSNLYKSSCKAVEPTARDDKSYNFLLRRNTSVALTHISETLLKVLLREKLYDKHHLVEDSCIKICGIGCFDELLPTISVVEDRVDYNHDLLYENSFIKAQKTHELPIIKKEILQMVPLIPMQIEKSVFEPQKALIVMTDLLKEEFKTKEYLTSDILYLKKHIVNMCRLLKDWIGDEIDENINYIRIQDAEKVNNALNSVESMAGAMLRECDSRSNEIYIEKLFKAIAERCDDKFLNEPPKVTDTSESYMEYACFSVLKLSRNWMAHNILERVSMDFVVFVFVVFLRYLINVNRLPMGIKEQYLYEETKIFDFFKQNQKKNTFEIKKEYLSKYQKKNIQEEYEKAYRYVLNNAVQKGREPNNMKFLIENLKTKPRNPHNILTLAGHSNSLIKTQMTEKEIFLAFCLGLHMGNDNQIRNLTNIVDDHILKLLNIIYDYQSTSFLLRAGENV